MRALWHGFVGGAVGANEVFRHRREYVPVGCVGDVLSPTLPKDLVRTDRALATSRH
jgi:hypothetical protein